tara:strand:+ start:477 stop:812 length:336 start_codon:yes stop_codon:yes gene_type:complete
MGEACRLIGDNTPGNLTELEFFKNVRYSGKKAGSDTEISGIGLEKLLPIRTGLRLFGGNSKAVFDEAYAALGDPPPRRSKIHLGAVERQQNRIQRCDKVRRGVRKGTVKIK